MSIPTSQDIPSLTDPKKLSDWARKLQEFLRNNLQCLAWPDIRITLPNGNSQNVNIDSGYVVHVAGPTGAFGIGGLTGGTAGRQVLLHNASSGTMTLREADASSSVGNRIKTFNGNVTVSSALLVWDPQSTTWILIGSIGPAASVAAAGSTLLNYYPWVGTHGTEFAAGQNAIDRILLGLATGAVAASSSTFSNGQYRVWPYISPRTITVNQVEIMLRSGATVGAKARIGVWLNDDAGQRRYPKTFFFDINEFDLSGAAPGARTITPGSTLTFTAGQLYWIGYNTNNSTPNIRVVPAANMEPMFSDDVTGTDFSFANCFSQNTAYPGSISGDFPQTGAVGAITPVPMVLMRVSSMV